MTRDEFDAWMIRHGTVFPSLRDWLVDRGDAVQAVLDIWFGALESIPAANAHRTTQRMLIGDVLALDRWTMERLPAVVINDAPRRLPTIEELNHEKTGWTPNGGYRG